MASQKRQTLTQTALLSLLPPNGESMLYQQLTAGVISAAALVMSLLRRDPYLAGAAGRSAGAAAAEIPCLPA